MCLAAGIQSTVPGYGKRCSQLSIRVVRTRARRQAAAHAVAAGEQKVQKEVAIDQDLPYSNSCSMNGSRPEPRLPATQRAALARDWWLPNPRLAARFSLDGSRSTDSAPDAAHRVHSHTHTHTTTTTSAPGLATVLSLSPCCWTAFTRKRLKTQRAARRSSLLTSRALHVPRREPTLAPSWSPWVLDLSRCCRPHQRAGIRAIVCVAETAARRRRLGWCAHRCDPPFVRTQMSNQVRGAPLFRTWQRASTCLRRRHVRPSSLCLGTTVEIALACCGIASPSPCLSRARGLWDDQLNMPGSAGSCNGSP